MIPRILISSISSSSGKTTVVSGLCAVLRGMEMKVAAVKVGPDFIDPMFHSIAGGVKSGNIDLYFTDEKKAAEIFDIDTNGADFALVEGAMGFFDGLGGESDFASSFHAARVLRAPVLIVADVRGKSLSVAAEILGVVELAKRRGGGGLKFFVLLNKCSESLFGRLKQKIEEICGVDVVGFLEENKSFKIESRHLGLVTPDSVPGIKEKISEIAMLMKKSVDIEKLVSAGKLCCEKTNPSISTDLKKTPLVKIAVAKDEAFSFYYRENLELLESFGAELCFFSPLRNEPVPDGSCALYIGGGYPELFWSELCDCRKSSESVRAACRNGLPVFAECGGFLYLQLLGILSGTFENKKHLVRFGYAEFECMEDNFLLKKGEKIRGHEFHYFDTTENGSLFTARKPGGKEWPCVQFVRAAECMKKPCCKKKNAPFRKNIVAGFPHFYFPSNPGIAENFVNAALVYDSLSGSESCSSCASCASCGSCGIF